MCEHWVEQLKQDRLSAELLSNSSCYLDGNRSLVQDLGEPVVHGFGLVLKDRLQLIDLFPIILRGSWCLM